MGPRGTVETPLGSPPALGTLTAVVDVRCTWVVDDPTAAAEVAAGDAGASG